MSVPLSSSPVPGPLHGATGDRPTLFLIGEDPFVDALAISLDQHGIAIERGSLAKVVEQVFVGAPDLVVLVGDAAHEDGEPVLRALAARPATATVPVVVVTDDPTLEARLSAFRSGAVAVVKKSASVDAMAKDIAAIARDVPSRSESERDDIGEATVDEIVELFSRRLRSGILAVTAPGAGPDAGARVMLRGDLPLDKAVEELVESIRPLVATPGQPLHVEFEERPTGKLARLDLDEEPADEADVRELLTGRRLLLIERSPTRADDLVQALRDRGALVVVIDGEGDGIERARAVDPDVAIVDERGVGGWAAGALRAMRRDARLRWASLLVVRGEELFPAGRPGPDVHRLAASIRPLIAPEEMIATRSAEDKPFDLRLETAGPVRLLRALARTGRTLHAIARSPRATIEIDVAEGLVVGAVGRVEGGGELAGAAAIAALLALGVARVSVSPRAAPSVANIMAPVDDALASADRESPPLMPSLPPPSMPPPARREPKGLEDRKTPSGSIDARELLQQLEAMLTQLRVSLPAPTGPGAAPIARPPASASGVRPQPPSKPARTLDVPPPRAALGAKVPAPVTAPATVSPPAPAPSPPSTVPELASPALAAKVPAPRSSKRTMMGVPAPSLAAPSIAAPVEMPALAPPSPPEPPAVPPVVATAAPVTQPAPPIVVMTPPVRIETPPQVVPPPSVAPGASAVSAAESELAAMIGSPSSPSVELAFEDEVPAHPSAAPPPAAFGVAREAVEAEEVAPPRSRTGLWIAVAVTLLLALVGGGGLLYHLRAGGDTLPDPSVLAPPPSPRPPATPPTVPTPVPTAPVAPEEATVAVVTPVIAPTPDVPLVAPPPEAAPPAVEPPPTVVAPDVEGPEGEVQEAPADEPTGRARDEEIHRLVNQANFDRNRGDLAAAERVYLQVLRIDYYNSRAMAGLARLHLAEHDPQGALVWARRLVAARPQQAGNHILLGDVLVLTGDEAGARRAWQQALEIQPRNRTALRRLGR